ncbi:hypothetical protein OKW43_007963 [Paraburkholderia sp. WC7.3g]
MTGVHFPNLLGDIAIDDEAVVNEKFVTGLDGSDRMNKNPIAGLDCLTVGCACMVQEAGAVAAAAAINYTAVGQTKNKGMPVFGLLAGGGAARTGHFALVLDEPIACSDGLQREQSFAVDRGTSCCDASQPHRGC